MSAAWLKSARILGNWSPSGLAIASAATQIYRWCVAHPRNHVCQGCLECSGSITACVLAMLCLSLLLVAPSGCNLTADAKASGLASGTATNSGGKTCPRGRYEIIDPGNPNSSYSADCPKAGSGCDGTGLVKDTQTGLVWFRFEYAPDPVCCQDRAEGAAYCESHGMRLPTFDEAMGIAGTSTSSCIWQPYWVTWTSEPTQTGRVLVVRNDGITLELDIDIDSAPVLCVQ